MKKLQSLGKSLTKNEQRKIIGGVVDPGGDAGTCGENCDKTCKVTCNGQEIDGSCSKNSKGKCFCSGVC